MRRIALVLLALLVATALACADEDAVDPWAYLPRSREFALAIEDPAARTRQPATRAELEAALPFEPVLPTWLPADVRFHSASVVLATGGREITFNGGFGRERPTQSEGFSWTMGYFQTAAPAVPPPLSNDADARVVDLGPVEGQLLLLTGGPPDRLGYMLEWDACGSRFVAILDVVDGTALDESDFLRMARSMVEACD